MRTRNEIEARKRDRDRKREKISPSKRSWKKTSADTIERRRIDAERTKKKEGGVAIAIAFAAPYTESKWGARVLDQGGFIYRYHATYDFGVENVQRVSKTLNRNAIQFNVRTWEF